MTNRCGQFLTVSALFLSMSGCNSSGLVNATGRLTCKGQPVPSTYVVFQPEAEGQRPSTGLTDDDGNFELVSSKSATGVYVGNHTVVLKYYVSGDEELGKVPPKASKELKAIIVKYGDPRTSTLKYEVKKSGQHFEIDIQ